jgi:uncharacterized membrane protein
MKRHWPQLIIVISGAVLIVMGMVAIGVQLFNQFMHNDFGGGFSRMDIVPPRAGLVTSYVGMELVVIGAVLEMVGYIGTAPWRKNSN